MKKNRTLRVSALLLALTLITTCFVGGTFAKYTSSVTTSDTAKVAKWQIKVNGTDVTVTDPQVTFDLFQDTVLDSDDTNAETDVKQGNTLIAPGTAGHFDIKVENLSEVNAKFTIAFTEEVTGNGGTDLPLEYQIVAKGASVADGAWKGDIAQLNTAVDSIAMESGTNEYTVHWRWNFADGTNDVNDTKLGVAAQGEVSVKVTATITVDQVD